MAWTSYFDKFVTFAEIKIFPPSLDAWSLSSRLLAGCLLKMETWLQVSYSVSARGVQLNAENTHCEIRKIDDTSVRKNDLLQLLDDVISSEAQSC